MGRLLRWIDRRAPGASRRAARRASRALRAWEDAGRPVPPPHVVKRALVRDLARRFGIRILVETGTYRGDMVAAMRPWFERIVSIELSEALHAAASRRFRGDPAVQLVQGDSGERLAEVVPGLEGPALFWLDGHWSAGDTARGATDTPVLAELAHVLRPDRPRDVVLIDDARCFGAERGYPTLAELEAQVLGRAPERVFEVQDDLIRITPPDGRPPGAGTSRGPAEGESPRG